MSNCHPLELVGQSSETQLQVGEKLNHINERERSSIITMCYGMVPIVLRHFPIYLLLQTHLHPPSETLLYWMTSGRI